MCSFRRGLERFIFRLASAKSLFLAVVSLFYCSNVIVVSFWTVFVRSTAKNYERPMTKKTRKQKNTETFCKHKTFDFFFGQTYLRLTTSI